MPRWLARRLPDGGFDVVATAADRQVLIEVFRAQLEIENMEEHYQRGITGTTEMGGYHTYSEAHELLYWKTVFYPALADLDTIVDRYKRLYEA